MQSKNKQGKNMHFEEILDEIENTLDKLIENASLMQEKAHLKEQVLTFQKTQEDLLKNLHSMNAFLEKNKKTIKMPKEKKINISKKLEVFEKLKKFLYDF